MVEADNAWLKHSETHHRAIKMSLVQQHCPQLIRRFEQQQRDKADKKSQVGKKKAASKVTPLPFLRPDVSLLLYIHMSQRDSILLGEAVVEEEHPIMSWTAFSCLPFLTCKL